MKDLNRAFRPRQWDDLIGQAEVVDICKKALAEDKFPKFSIFCGPTGVGKSCMAELIACQLTGYTGDIESAPCIKKYNMAALVGKKDIVEIIDSIFKYKSVASGAFVYILEEVQVLKQREEQTPFLEELTKIPDGVYIMMCTTKISSLSVEMRNRAVAFQLTLPSYEDCTYLVQSVVDRLGFTPISPHAMEVLIKSSNYTPRSILKHIELLASSETVSEEDVNRFFHIVSNSDYIKALSTLTSDDVSLYEMVKQINAVLAEQHAQNFVRGLRDFAIQYLIERASGEKQMMLSSKDRALCTELLDDITEGTFAALFSQLLKIDLQSLEDNSDTLASLIKVKLAVLGKTPTTVIRENASSASEALINNKKLARHTAATAPKKELISINSALDLTGFGIEDNTTYEE